jgi:hypothetical protein
MTVGVTIFIDVDHGPGTRLRKDPYVGVSGDPVVGFAALTVDKNASSSALLNNWRCADREAALIKNRLVSACVDFASSPCADAGNAWVLHVGIDVEAI